MQRAYQVLLKRAGSFAATLALVFVLAACGGTTTAPAVTSAPTAGAVTAVPTDSPTPCTCNASSPTNTSGTAGQATTGTSDTTPTVAMMASPSASSSGQPAAGATPVSNWKPGVHANTITAPSKLTTGGTLTVGSDASYPPQEYIGADGVAVGFDIDVAQELASRMGLQLKVVNFKFDDIIPALNAGQFDAVISAMSITDDRKKVVNFVQYFSAGQAVLVKKGNPLNIKALTDLSGHTAAVEQGTVEETTLTDLNTQLKAAGKPAVTVLTYGTDTDAVDQLRVGRADATLHDAPVAVYYTHISPDAFEVGISSFSGQPEGIAVAQNNQPMLDAVNKAITAMQQDGTMDAILTKWGLK